MASVSVTELETGYTGEHDFFTSLTKSDALNKMKMSINEYILS